MDGGLAPDRLDATGPGTGKSAPDRGRGRLHCRFCAGPLRPVTDLGISPPCESFLRADQLDAGEACYPLAVKVCPTCWLVQLGEFVPPEDIFTEYAYFSSYSQAWLTHARDYVAAMQARFGLGAGSFVVEVASNDGYLLRNAVERGIPCLGIEPAVNVAKAAEAAGVPTLTRFFGAGLARQLVEEGRAADLVTGNNVLAQVPDLNDFVAGLAILLKPDGVLTLEFPHLARLIAENQFDTIYHEHFSYFSFATVERILAAQGLRAFDVEELWTHGGSLRVLACRADASHRATEAPARLRAAEQAAGLERLSTYAAFDARVRETKWRLLELLIGLRREGRRVVGYGAPGKGNTLLNFCGIRSDLIEFTVDRNPYKHGRFTPGTRIPVLPPDALDAARPDIVVILPWNLRDEITAQLHHIRGWGGRFVVPIPEPRILD